ncbi:copper chaperone PCu(A)C [Gymnodinialimonas ceratoperidinii]|uniref:Copper chaperone PCu(A)C n=1 Tax=Gymnodinialimonas ceratoperidinii TaxID=2856823 RepID=A0A8F6YB81_9RHOB|nr:copper chaperone PCu(A)C [Gymnodinialimonas ceratoperidinii]QXT40704.1 copper chaperone PCu(A)C [Gymnodinialimonas ceratoperidinii]
MTFKTTLLATAFAVLPTLASAHMVIEDAYARASSPVAQTGATFLTLFNHSDTDDRLIGASSEAAERLELHTHIEEDNGIMRMREVEDGFPVAAGERIHLTRGGMHVMMLGLTGPLVQGEEIEVTFTFEHADPVTQTIVIDNERQPGAGAHGEHADHGAMDMDMDDADHSGHGSDH